MFSFIMIGIVDFFISDYMWVVFVKDVLIV